MYRRKVARPFSGCARLTRIEIPRSVFSIGYLALSDCAGLKHIGVDVANVSYSSLNGILFNRSGSVLVQYPAGRFGEYTIPNSVMSIGSSAFSGCIGLSNLTVSGSVKNIDSLAFFGCSTLSSVIFQGNAPQSRDNIFPKGDELVVYFFPETVGWAAIFAGRPTKQWNALEQISLINVGVKDGEFGFSIAGVSGIPVVIEAATNVNQTVWTPVSTNTLIGGMAHFVDPDWREIYSRLYRLRRR